METHEKKYFLKTEVREIQLKAENEKIPSVNISNKIYKEI